MRYLTSVSRGGMVNEIYARSFGNCWHCREWCESRYGYVAELPTGRLAFCCSALCVLEAQQIPDNRGVTPANSSYTQRNDSASINLTG